MDSDPVWMGGVGRSYLWALPAGLQNTGVSV
jgi:hypothetical protein